MAITVKHNKVSTVPDGDDTSVVRPSDWNADHTLVGTIDVANGGTGASTASAGLNNLLPSQTGNNGKVLSTDGINASWSTNGSGDVVGPASATDNAIARFDQTTGKLIQNSVTTIDDTGNASGILSQQFSNGSAVALAAGKFWYNGSTGSWNAGMGGGLVTQQIGEELYRYGKASAAITDSPLQLVYKTGVVGASGVITFAPAVAGIPRGDDILGCATEPIANNGFGRITTYGIINNITTNGTAYGETWVDNDDIYYNPTTGGLTKTVPTAPNLKLLVGTVINAGSGGSGSFIVKLGVATYLSALSDVTVSGATSGQQLVYNGTIWTNSNAPTISGGTINNTTIGATTATTGAFTTLTSTGGAVNGTVGATTPATGKFSTLESTGTGSFGTTSAQYIQAVGNALYPQILAVGSGTNIPLVLQPKGTGALQAQLTDSTTTGGNARGANAVDFQMVRSTAAQVASASTSFIGNGRYNTASGQDSVVVGGYGNTASSVRGVIAGGESGTASGNNCYVGSGYQNTAAGNLNFIGGGQANSGTSGSSVTTQTAATTSGLTAVTLSGSNANIKVGQWVEGTGINNYTYVSAVSGTSLTLSANASSTNAAITLTFKTPHGVVVGGGNNQATGSYSFIGGGGDAGTAANRNVASGDWSSVLGGFKNTATNVYDTVGGGFTNAASGGYSVIGGGQNQTATGSNASILGGRNNTCNAGYGSIVAGLGAFSKGICGVAQSGANYFSVVGDAQSATYVLSITTTNATATALTTNQSAASTLNQVVLPNNQAYAFTGVIVARNTSTNDVSSWEVKGAIKRGAGVGTTALVGIPTVTSIGVDAGAATWALAVSADTTNGGLSITATGVAATTIRWVAQITTAEVG